MSASEWRVPAEQIAETSIIPPADFAGEMNLSATLRGSDGIALVSSFVRLSWPATPPNDAVAASADAPIEPSVVLPTQSQRQQAAAAQTMASFGAPTQNVSTTSQTAEEPTSGLAPSEIAYLVRRAQERMVFGDVQAARLLLIRAARAHDAHAALLLAKSYDPNLARKSSAGDPGTDPEQARIWYQKAREWGSPEAQRQLDTLASSYR
jgi:TPR repeat protein